MARVVSLYLKHRVTGRVRKKSVGGSLPPEAPLVMIGWQGSRRLVMATAAELGIAALGVVDRNSIAGVVRAHQAVNDTGMGTARDARKAEDRLRRWLWFLRY